jgi:hypothetical protein
MIFALDELQQKGMAPHRQRNVPGFQCFPIETAFMAG